MGLVRKELLSFLFSGTTLLRWNGFIHPTELYEVDRQAHKMIVAWFLFMLEAPKYSSAERITIYQELVEGAIFDYCLNLTITDIKPNIYERIQQNTEHYKKITEWGIQQFSTLLYDVDPQFCERAQEHLTPPKKNTVANDILRAASLYATMWEFTLLQEYNSSSIHCTTIQKSLSNAIERQCERVPSLSTLMPSLCMPIDKCPIALSTIPYMCGTLRFQKRWSQVPRLPETSVLGHSFLVACYSYMFSLVLNACPVRACNTFFTGLFHDIPELLTQDIINPVKHSSPEIARIIREYEEFELAQQIFSPLEAENPELARRLQYLLGHDVGSEFRNTIIDIDIPMEVSYKQLHELYNSNSFDPKDGILVKVCDSISALLEANTSIINGVYPSALLDAKQRIIHSIEKRIFSSELTAPMLVGVEEYLMPHIDTIVQDIKGEGVLHANK